MISVKKNPEDKGFLPFFYDAKMVGFVLVKKGKKGKKALTFLLLFHHRHPKVTMRNVHLLSLSRCHVTGDR